MLAVALLAPAAPAAADSLSFGVSPARPRDSVPFDLHYSGQVSAHHAFVTAYWQGRRDRGCPADPNAQPNGASFADLDFESVRTGSFKLTTPRAGLLGKGTKLLCAYLQREADDSHPNPPVLARATRTIHVRPIHHIRLKLHFPKDVQADQLFNWSVSFHLPESADALLWVTIKPAVRGAHCAHNRFGEPSNATNMIAAEQVGGSTPVRSSGHFTGPGRHLVCAWIQRTGPEGDSPLAGPVSKLLVVRAPHGGRGFKGKTSQGLGIRFRVRKRQLFGTVFSLRFRCTGSAPTTKPVQQVRLDSFSIGRSGGFDRRYSDGLSGGIFKGKAGRHKATGTLNETYPADDGNTCRSGKVSWHAHAR